MWDQKHMPPHLVFFFGKNHGFWRFSCCKANSLPTGPSLHLSSWICVSETHQFCSGDMNYCHSRVSLTYFWDRASPGCVWTCGSSYLCLLRAEITAMSTIPRSDLRYLKDNSEPDKYQSLGLPAEDKRKVLGQPRRPRSLETLLLWPGG